MKPFRTILESSNLDRLSTFTDLVYLIFDTL